MGISHHIERFAPSPTGRLHLGHAYSARMGYEAAKAAGGTWILRIEDIDFTRSRPEFVDGIFEDLRWLGFDWTEPVVFQSARSEAYQEAFEKLKSMGLIYGCECTRRDLALSAPHGTAPHYTGTCRGKKLVGENLNWRLDAKRAVKICKELSYREIGQNRDITIPVNPEWLDDVVLARRDIGVSYHLAVVVDDAFQGVTHVTRGADLEEQTPIHVLLQRLLDLPTPIYRHHILIKDAQGKRLAKRDAALEIAQLRKEGSSPDQIWQLMSDKKNN